MYEGGSISLRETQNILDAPQCECRWTIQGLGCPVSRLSKYYLYPVPLAPPLYCRFPPRAVNSYPLASKF